MPRLPRIALGGYVYHVLNRANGRKTIFGDSRAYKAFDDLLVEANEHFNMRILAYVLMPNHWHLLLYPREDNDMVMFMQWLTMTHAARFRVRTDTIGEGHLYQARYKSFLVDSDTYLLTALKYIERNPVRAQLAKVPEEWKWGSAYRRIFGTTKEKSLLAVSPTPLPHRYREWIHEPENTDDLKEIRSVVNKGVAFGSEHFRNSILGRKGKP